MHVRAARTAAKSAIVRDVCREIPDSASGELEALVELFRKCFGTGASNLDPTASLRTVGREGGAAVPHVVGSDRQVGSSNVRFDPLHRGSLLRSKLRAGSRANSPTMRPCTCRPRRSTAVSSTRRVVCSRRNASHICGPGVVCVAVNTPRPPAPTSRRTSAIPRVRGSVERTRIPTDSYANTFRPTLICRRTYKRISMPSR